MNSKVVYFSHNYAKIVNGFKLPNVMLAEKL